MTVPNSGVESRAPRAKAPARFERALVSSTVIAPALTFGSAPLIARAVGLEGRGTLAAVVSAFMIVRYLSSLGGIDAALAAASWNGVGVGGSLSAVGRWIAPITVVVAGVAWVAAPLIFLRDEDAVGIFRLLLIIIPFVAISDGWRAALTTGQRTVPVVAHILSMPAVRLMGAVAVVVFGIDSVATASWISVGGALLGFFVVAAVSVPEIRATSLRREHEVRFRKFARQLAPGQAARLGNLRLDQVMLGAVAGASQLGVYAVAVAVAEFSDVFTRSFRQIAIRSINDHADSDVDSISASVDHVELERLFRVGLVFWVPTSFVVMALIPVGIPLVFGDEFAGAVWPAEILVIAGLAGYVRDILGLVLIRTHAASRDSVVQVTALVVAVVAVIAFGSAWGAWGAALAALVSYLTGAVAVVVLYRKERALPLKNLLPGRVDVRDAYVMVRR